MDPRKGIQIMISHLPIPLVSIILRLIFPLVRFAGISKYRSSVGKIVQKSYEKICERDGEDLAFSILAGAFYEIGEEHGRKIRQFFGREPTLNEAARIAVEAQRFWGMKTRIVSNNGKQVITKTNKCSWAPLSGWNAKLCEIMEAYEIALISTMNGSIRHLYTARRSKGANACVGIFRIEAENEKPNDISPLTTRLNAR
jgi:hypothetical protein